MIPIALLLIGAAVIVYLLRRHIRPWRAILLVLLVPVIIIAVCVAWFIWVDPITF